MTETRSVGPSRDGDQFHYHWAARRALRLLQPGTDLTAIAVEGASPDDTETGKYDEVIDISEYYGSSRLADATMVKYIQLKHSTLYPDEEQTVSALSKTLRGFAGKYTKIKKELPGVEKDASFIFVSNFPMRASISEAVEYIAAGGGADGESRDAGYIRKYLGLDQASDEAAFCQRFRIEDGTQGLRALKKSLSREVQELLPGVQGAESVLLKEEVAQRATSQMTNNLIDRNTVLAALGATEDRLFPASCQIEYPESYIETTQTRQITSDFLGLTDQPMVVHAAGGVGKSALASQIAKALPTGSVSLVYDCFGLGGYRNEISPRHGHRQGLVQLANELASYGLCAPLIPNDSAQPHEYLQAFVSRVEIAAAALAAQAPEALLSVVVDAADNAELIARDRGEPSFVPGLLRTTLPDNTRLMMLCRTERIELLNPPPSARLLELEGFEVTDTARFLRSTYEAASEVDAVEFHRRTGGNPRVQATTLGAAGNLHECLVLLGEAKPNGSVNLDELLQQGVNHCRDSFPGSARQVDQLCIALATLRPRIPVGVLSRLCGVPASAIKSFAADLGRPLLVDGETLQFRDEPTETWFRTQYRPTNERLVEFISHLAPLANTEPYVALSLPRLLWEAGQAEELVRLALSDEALPQVEGLERKEIAQQRAHFALKAALRSGHELNAVRLALRAGSLAAGHSRRLSLIRENTDLAGEFLDDATIADLIATRSLHAGWAGSHLHYEGALLSARSSESGLARSRLRSANEWMVAWTRQSGTPDRHQVDASDIAEVAFGLLNLEGVRACIAELSRWRPRTVAFDAGFIIARRLADAGRMAELEMLGRGMPRSLKYLQFAVACAAWEANFVCSAALARHLVKTLKHQRRRLDFQQTRRPRPRSSSTREERAATWIVAMGLRHAVLSNTDAERLLLLHLPAGLGNGAGERWNRETEVLLCGFALLARARGTVFDVADFAGPDVVKAKDAPTHVHDRTLSEHAHNVVPLAPWAALWVEALCSEGASLEAPFMALADKTFRNYGTDEPPYLLIRGVARFGAKVAALAKSAVASQRFTDWCGHAPLIGPEVLIDVVRTVAPVPAMHPFAILTAERVRSRLEVVDEEANYRVSQMTKLARAVIRFNREEARAYFNQAIELADQVGDEVFQQWRALMALARAAATVERRDDRRAYRLAQVADGLRPHLTEALDDPEVLNTIGGLSPTTAIAVASRWRDRNDYSNGLFAEAQLAEGSHLAPDPIAALSLLPFRDFNALDCLTRAIRYAPEHGYRVARVIGEYLRHKRYIAGSFDALDSTAAELGIELTRTELAPTRRCSGPEPEDAAGSSHWLGENPADRAERVDASKARLAGCDLTSVEGWSAAFQLLASREESLRDADVVDHAMQVPLAGLFDMVAAYLEHGVTSVFFHSALIDRLAEYPNLPRSVRMQAEALARAAAMRFRLQIATATYDPIDQASLTKLAAGTTQNLDLVGIATLQLGADPEALTAEQCFGLAGKLATRLSPTDAQTALDDLTNAFILVAPLDSADGEFDSVPSVPATRSECLAGYLWAALGAPETGTRWEAAHCVRLLIALGCADEITALHQFAQGTLESTPFVDHRLPFYELHARQWLLLAIARAALDPDSQDQVATFVPLLRAVAFGSDPHIVMQASASSALRALATRGVTELTEEEENRCVAINEPVAVLSGNWSDLMSRAQADPADDSDEQASDEKPASPQVDSSPRFFFDFKDHWCRPLAEAFGMSATEIERLARVEATEHVDLQALRSLDQDPRSALELYGRNSTYVYKFDWPEADDLRFYLAVHSLLTVAGRLIKDRPTYRDDEMDLDLYEKWLEDFQLTRRDGRWLADRRDAPPASAFITETTSPDPDWVWRLSKDHFTEYLLPGEDWVTVWEYSDDRTYQANQRVQIRSALVAPGKARSLALALQTAPTFLAYQYPTTDQPDWNLATEGFELTGWIQDQGGREGIDNKDPLGASICYPPARPDDAIIKLLNLMPDDDMRLWTRDGKSAARATNWDDTRPAAPGRTNGREGHRLEIRRGTLQDLLQSLEQSMVIAVAIEREHERLKPKNYERITDDGNNLPFLGPSWKVFLFDDSGECRTL